MAQLLKPVLAPKSKRQYRKLPVSIRKKFSKQLKLIIENYRHPSLRTRRMGGKKVFEARIDIHYRFTFQIEEESIFILTIGPHDEGLGKK